MPQLIEFAPTALLIVGSILMVIAFALSFVPILPGPMIPWAVGIMIGLLGGWQRVTPTAGIIMTIGMLIAATGDYWRPLLGASTGNGMTCKTALGSMVGGIVGTFLIPIPLVGTLIGIIGGALVVEYLQFRDLKKAFSAGRFAFNGFVIGYVLNIALSVAILLTYFISIFSTG
jgi:uncharacterized protein